MDIKIISLGSKGQTKDLITGRHLNGLYNSRNSIKIKFIWDVENKGIL